MSGPDAPEGTVWKGVGGQYTVHVGDDVYTCLVRGALRRTGLRPLVGDRVRLAEADPGRHTAVIERILPRRNVLLRPAVANADICLAVIAAAQPEPDLHLLDRLLITAELRGLRPILLINKTDQDGDGADALEAQYRFAAHTFKICTARETGRELSWQALWRELDGHICVLAGQSGVGKSSFLNLAAGAGRMETGALSERTRRGRHTTRHAELFHLTHPCLQAPTYAIDAPGFGVLELDIPPKDLPKAYPEVYNNSGGGVCRFPDCSHTGEPDCFVRELVERGAFPRPRYERYREFYKMLAEKERNQYRSGKG